MATRKKIICILNCTNSVKNKLKHLSCEQIAAAADAAPKQRHSELRSIQCRRWQWRWCSYCSRRPIFTTRPNEIREWESEEKPKICKMKINRKKRSVAKQTHTHTFTKADYNNLQHNKRHSAPINTVGGAVPRASHHQIQTEIIYDSIRCSVLSHPMPHVERCTQTLSFSRCGRCHRLRRVC